MRHFLTLLLVTAALAAVSAQVDLTFTQIASGFSQPTDLVASPDSSNRLFVVEKGGRIKVIDLLTGEPSGGNFLNMNTRVSTNSERGLLSMAFHPDFANNGEFYVHYSASESSGIQVGANVISRFTLPDPAATTVDASTEEILLVSPQDFANHNGGDMSFGPDGFLYVGIGDGGSGGDPNDNGQNPQNLMGTLIRIDVDTAIVGGTSYGIPATNPFADGVGGRAEVYSYGLRNPWRFSFDRETGDLWIADVGQNEREEINFTPANTGNGLNYGWDCREGDIAYPGPSSAACSPSIEYTEPIVSIDHISGPFGGFSITGGFVYRGTDWPELFGTYICADFVTNNIFSVVPDDIGGWDLFSETAAGVSSVTAFGESQDGELFVVTFGGTVFQIGGGISNTRNFFNRNFDIAVAVSPNPASTELNVQLTGVASAEILKMKLIDAQGRPVMQQTWSIGAGDQNRRLHLPILPVGLYQLVLTNAKGGTTLPVVISGRQ